MRNRWEELIFPVRFLVLMKGRIVSLLFASSLLVLTLALPVSAQVSPNLLYSCHNLTAYNQPPYTVATYTFNPSGQPINGYAYLDRSSAPVGFSYTWYSSTYALKVSVTNNNNVAVNYEFTYCFVYNWLHSDQGA
jgi:hypothetical protein